MAINLVQEFFYSVFPDRGQRRLLSFYFSVTVDGNTVSGRVIR